MKHSAYGAHAARTAAAAIQGRTASAPRVGIILGSGLGGIASLIESATRIPYRDVPGFPSATVTAETVRWLSKILPAFTSMT